jgi:hypothetical protein
MNGKNPRERKVEKRLILPWCDLKDAWAPRTHELECGSTYDTPCLARGIVPHAFVVWGRDFIPFMWSP